MSPPPPAGEGAHEAIRFAVSQRAAASPWPQWWTDTVQPTLLSLPDRGSLVGLRQQLVESFVTRMVPAGMDRFDAAGMAATWWEDSLHELQTAVSRGWKTVIEAWLTTAEANQGDKTAPDLAAQPAIQLLAGPQVASRTALVDALAVLNADIKAAEATDDEEYEEDEDDDSRPTLADIKKMKSERTKAKKTLKALDASLMLTTARQNLDVMPAIEATAQAIGLLRTRIEGLVADHYADIARSTFAWYDNLVNKYGTTLRDLEAERDAANAHLDKHLGRLGYG